MRLAITRTPLYTFIIISSRDEISSYTTNSILTELHVSFSRDKDYPYRYVQDRIRENGKELVRLITEEDAVVYLCGDAKNMAPDVKAAWIKIFEKFGGEFQTDILATLLGA